MEMTGSDIGSVRGAAAPSLPLHRLSCDQCRQRKVRCDRVVPCGPCSSRQIQCSFPAGFKQRAKRQHPIVADDYGSKLDDISNKLDQICLAVGSISSPASHSQGRSAGVHTSLQTSPSVSSPFTGTVNGDESTESNLEGDVTLNEEATFATEFAEQAVGNHQALHVLPEVKSSLDALRRVLFDRGGESFGGRSSETDPPTLSPQNAGLKLPPMEVAMAAIQRLRESQRLRFFWCMEIHSINQFVEYFMTVYSGKPSLAELIIVNYGLYVLCAQCASHGSNEGINYDFTPQAMLCQQNLESILPNIPLNLPSTFHYVLALQMASSYYLERCQISLAWNFLSVAAQKCLTLGFDRQVALIPEGIEARQRRIRVFWIIHMTDKMLSLRLNRASLLRDEHITLNLDEIEPSTGDYLTPISPKWIKLSMLQGKVYDDIYCPRALLHSQAVREAKARELAAEMRNLYEQTDVVENQLIESSKRYLPRHFHDAFMRADKVSCLALLTLIYRSIRPSSDAGSAFCDECLDAANQSLEEHKICIELLRGTDTSMIQLYIQWALQSIPFTPFIVLFCHTVETRNPIHLDKLASVIDSLEQLGPDLMNIYGKQLRLFKPMYEVAYKYVNALPTDIPMQSPRGVSDAAFEDFFLEASASLGGKPSRYSETHGFHGMSNQGFGMSFGESALGNGGSGDVDGNYTGAGIELGNWFDHNHQVFRMLEDDNP